MNENEFYEYKKDNFLKIVEWLNEEVLPKAIDRVNTNKFKLMTSKLLSERLPQNQRNLTDARTRIGTLLEYCLAVELNDLLSDYQLEGFITGFVLANRYPDLVVRDRNFEQVLRLEIKSIEGISEEKSANFDVGIRNIDKNSDVVCVMLWEWERIVHNNYEIEFPKVHRVYAFDAYTLAQYRDINWLNKVTGKSFKLIDISGVFVPNGDKFKEEEGNMGKLLRIDTHTNKDVYVKNNYTTELYEKFKKEVILFGLMEISKRTIEIFSSSKLDTVKYYENEYDSTKLNILGDCLKKDDNSYLIIIGGTLRSLKTLKNIVNEHLEEQNIQASSINVMVYNEKFSWKYYKVGEDGSAIEIVAIGNKPESAYEKAASK